MNLESHYKFRKGAEDGYAVYQSGTSEQYLGRALRDYAKRVDVAVATKFLPRTQEEIEKGITGQQRRKSMSGLWETKRFRR